MKKIAIMDTSIMSFNLGDQIIMESARMGLKEIIDTAFVINMPTHSPLYHWYEFSICKKDSFTKSLNSIDLKFVCGTNLLEKNMKKRKNSWNIHMLDTHYFNDFVLVGVGTDGLEIEPNSYTQKLYKKALSNKYIHSTRDEKTKIFLESMGFKAINTGCVTLWGLTKEHCREIPKEKANEVVFTITDYAPDIERDCLMIKTLCENYKKVFFWPQGLEDYNYIEKLGLEEAIRKRIQVLDPTLKSYNDFLHNHNCDYVGTRLHAGIKALQMKKRSLIISVDNRAKDMKDSYDLPLLERDKINELGVIINRNSDISININEGRIKEFLLQFSDKD